MAIAALGRERRDRTQVKSAFVTFWGIIITIAGLIVKPHQASIANLWNVPFTVAGLGCADYAAFHVSAGLGWLVTGASLVLIEHLIADDTS